MRVGVITDVHGNSVALDAVLADAAMVGIDEWWVLGDLFAVGSDPVGVYERVRALPNATFVRGNTERYVLDNDGRYGLAWTAEQLGAERCAWIGELPTHARFGATLLVHASPGRDDGPGLDRRLTDEQLHVLVRGCEAERIFVGHTHRHFDRVAGGVRIVNPGSVGNPIEPDLCAGWAVVDGDDVELRRVAYDRDAAIEQTLSCGIPEHGRDAVVAHLRGERTFTNPNLVIDVLPFEPPVEAKRA